MVRAAAGGPHDRVSADRPFHHAEPGVSRITLFAAALAVLGFLAAGRGDALRPANARSSPPPIPFVPNAGQWATDVAFAARAAGTAVALGPGRVEIATGGGRRLLMELSGSDRGARPAAQEPLTGTASFYRGRDRSRWRAGLPTYASVRYGAVYPGIDMTWHGRGGCLEYDFTVAPGADPSRIRIGFPGTAAISIDRGGDLVLSLRDEEVRHLRPVAHQERDGGREPVDVRWSLDRAGKAHFSVGPYDPSRALVIDPVIAGSAVLGGAGFDSANAIAVDGAGNVYVAGETGSADFPAPPSSRGGNDVFVAKLDPTGRTLLSSTFVGGLESDTANAVAVDGNGDVWVGGETLSSDFPTTSGAFQEELAGASDAFVARLDSSGVLLEWATYLGGEGFDRVNGVAASASGVAVTGRTGSMAFPTTPGAFQDFFRGSDFDAFLTRFDLAGAVVDSSFLGGSENDAAFGVAFGPSGSVFVVGGTRSPDFPATANAYQGSNFSTDAFVSVFSATGVLSYSTFLGGSFIDRGNTIAVDPLGRAVVAGWTSSPDFPSVLPVQAAFRGGGNDAFVALLDPSRTGEASLLFASFFGGSGDDRAHGVAFDAAGAAYVVGQTSSSDFPVVDPAPAGSGGGESDAFVTKLELAATPRIRYSLVAGGGGDDRAHAVAANPSGEAVVAGRTDSPGFPPNASRYGSGGGTDAFVARIAEGQAVPPAVPTLSVEGLAALAVLLAAAGALFAQRV